MQSVYLIIFSKVFLKICYVRWKSSNTAVITARFFFQQSNNYVACLCQTIGILVYTTDSLSEKQNL